VPDGNVDWERTKCGGPAVSNKPTRTVVVAVPTVVEDGRVVVVVGVVVGAGVVVTAAGPTEKTPFMPAAAWPETVLRYGYEPLFENVTRKVAERPGKRSGVRFPPILKLWEILPLLVTVKITVPAGTRCLDNVNLYSIATTVTRTVPVEWDGKCEAFGPAAPPGTRTPAATPATVSAASRTTLPRRMGNS